MISLNTLNQINDIMTILNNTRKAIAKQQSDKSFDQLVQQAENKITVQTPAQTVQQTTILPSKPQYNSMLDTLCCVDDCNKPAKVWIDRKPYCKEHSPESRITTEED